MTDPYKLPAAPLDMKAVSTKFNMRVAYRLARRRKGHYRQVKAFDKDLEANIEQLCEEAAAGTFHSSPYVHKTITDGRKERLIAKSSLFRDRVFQWSIMNVWMDPLLRIYSVTSHASTPGRGIHTALEQVKALVADPKNKYCLQIDIRKFFPSINRQVLKTIVWNAVGDENQTAIRTLNEIIDGAPDTGVPIGNLLSQFLANLYLTPFDLHLLEQTDKEDRYMDDVLSFAETPEELRRLLRDIEWYLRSVLFLDIKPNWQIFKVESRGIDFVGYRVFPDGRVIMRKDSFLKMRRKLKKIQKKAEEQHTLTDRERSVVFSHFGWVIHCSYPARIAMYNKIFKPIIEAANIRLKPKTRRKLWSK